MANVQPEHGYTKIADEILEQMARIKLSPTQYRILFVVWRFTYGFNRKEHELSLGFISNATGCDKRQIQRELKSLNERKIIVQKVINGISRTIMFNKNHDEWVGETTVGEITIGETVNGEIVEGTIGETDNGTIGETVNQEIHSLNTSLKTASLLESDLEHDEIIHRSKQIEDHYCMRRGILDASGADYQEIQKVVAFGIPVDFIKNSIDQSFKEYAPKYPKDSIRRFSYLATAIYDRWSKYQQKNMSFEVEKAQKNNVHPFPRQQGSKQKPQIPIAQPSSAASVSPERLEEIRRKAKKLDEQFNNKKSEVLDA